MAFPLDQLLIRAGKEKYNDSYKNNKLSKQQQKEELIKDQYFEFLRVLCRDHLMKFVRNFDVAEELASATLNAMYHSGDDYFKEQETGGSYDSYAQKSMYTHARYTLLNHRRTSKRHNARFSYIGQFHEADGYLNKHKEPDISGYVNHYRLLDSLMNTVDKVFVDSFEQKIDTEVILKILACISEEMTLEEIADFLNISIELVLSAYQCVQEFIKGWIDDG